MICKYCGSEYDNNSFAVCPFCMMAPEINGSISGEVRADEVVDDEVPDENSTLNDEDAINGEFGIDVKLSEDDLREDYREPQDITVQELGLSNRALNALINADITSLSQLIDYLQEHDVSELRNVGTKTIAELQIERLLRATSQPKADENIKQEAPLFADMLEENELLGILALEQVGLPHRMAVQLLKKGYKSCGQLRMILRKEFERCIGKRNIEELSPVAISLQESPVCLLKRVLSDHEKTKNFEVLCRRAKGETLQSIANNREPGQAPVTRERIRQQEGKILKIIMPFVENVVRQMIKNKQWAYAQDLFDVFQDTDTEQIILYLIKQLEAYKYIDYASVIVKKEIADNEVQAVNSLKELIGDGANIEEVLHEILEILSEYQMDYLSTENLVQMLKNNGLYVFGEFITPSKARYAPFFMHVIHHRFPNGVHLAQSGEATESDVPELREIVRKEYGGLEVEADDRAISACLVRQGLVLRGKGLYISPENIVIDEVILQNIKEYIDGLDEKCIYYSELYTAFEGPLNALSGIDNYIYLGGVLKWKFPNDYYYNRFYFLKKDSEPEEFIDIGDRIRLYVKQNNRPVTLSDLKEQFPGFGTSVILSAVANDSRILLWDKNTYICAQNLNISEQDKDRLRSILEGELGSNDGYTSEYRLFNALTKCHEEFVNKNRISSKYSAFSIFSHMFADVADFNRPHVCLKGIVDISSTRSVFDYLVRNMRVFSYRQAEKIMLSNGWSSSLTNILLGDLSDTYAHISADEYERWEALEVSENVIREVRQVIESNMSDMVLPIMSIDFSEIIEWDGEMNGFVFESIVRKYLEEYRIIQPMVCDRRYQRGIITRADSGLFEYGQVVAHKMKACGFDSMPDYQFLSFLILHNLTRSVIPGELEYSQYLVHIGQQYYRNGFQFIEEKEHVGKTSKRTEGIV